MNITTWNVNSLRARLDRVLAWLEKHRPDVACLQETKCADHELPRAELEALGYQVLHTGEPGRNGVALLSRRPIEEPLLVLPGQVEDDQRRFVAGQIDGTTVVCVYVPNGQGVATDAFFYKLDWLSRLLGWVKSTKTTTDRLVLAGDFNVCPSDLDVHDPLAWKGRLHCTDHERKAVARFVEWGLVDLLRKLHPEKNDLFSWFDYMPKSIKKHEGLRIDLLLATPPLVERLEAVTIDLDERRAKGPSKPSDHCPVTARFRA